MSKVIYPGLDRLIPLQSRVEVNEQLIDEYAVLMADGLTAFEPVDGVEDGEGEVCAAPTRTSSALFIWPCCTPMASA